MTDREKAIVMAYTGYVMLAGDKLSIYYHYVQEKLCRCVMTHELAYEKVQDAIQEAAKEDFIALAKSDNGWISAKDGHPSRNKVYLITLKTPEGPPQVMEAYLDYGGAWWRGNVSLINEYVTHWMPPPELPEEGEAG